MTTADILHKLQTLNITINSKSFRDILDVVTSNKHFENIFCPVVVAHGRKFIGFGYCTGTHTRYVSNEFHDYNAKPYKSIEVCTVWNPVTNEFKEYNKFKSDEIIPFEELGNRYTSDFLKYVHKLLEMVKQHCGEDMTWQLNYINKMFNYRIARSLIKALLEEAFDDCVVQLQYEPKEPYEMVEMKYQKESTFKILASGVHRDFPYWVISLGTHPCSYVDVTAIKDSLVASEVRCHGGVTFDDDSLMNIWDEFTDGFKTDAKRFIGWDYSHIGDYREVLHFSLPNDHKWTTEELVNEVKEVIDSIS